MTLDTFIQNLPENLKEYGLVFSEPTKLLLDEAQNSLPNRQHQVQPIQLTNGDWLLCADILSEIGESGIYRQWFLALPQEHFNEVEIVNWNETVALLPTPENEI